MRGAAPRAGRDYGEHIARALATAGGHLAIGRGGVTLHFDQGSRLSGCAPGAIKEAAVAAGLPVIDSRDMPFEAVWRLAVQGPMVAVGRAPDPPPWHALAYAPLEAVAAAYRDAGAEVLNLDPPGRGPAG
jgi:hypothetical protein